MRSMCLRTALVAVVTAVGIASTFSQSGEPRAGLVQLQHTIESKALGERRAVLVTLPESYTRGERKYPVVVMLDAHPPQTVMMSGILDQQAWGGVMPQMILVGIPNVNRVRDLTPTATERPGSGGGAKFLEFIGDEVLPLIDREYRTQPYRIFAGHSLAGLFVTYAMVERPELFGAYIAASPVLGWDKDLVIKAAEKAFARGFSRKTTYFAGIGDEPEYQEGFDKFQSYLKRSKPKELSFEFRQFKEDNHGSVVLPAYYSGLRMVYDGWAPPQSGTLADVDRHYKRLSERYGYAIDVPEQLMNRIGYGLLNAGRTDEAIDAFKRNTKAYPRSANVYDSLAEAYEKAGKLKDARDNYEKAYKLAEEQKEDQLARTAKANYERLVEKTR